tara:strand:- start:2121 stop:3956 length:1836 start_codon:yes stop_codon:yes gene_type:complete
MKLQSVAIKGFKSFNTEQTFDFKAENGLFLVRGDNRQEPSLGANGAGKSTFWDAICWAFFGKTARGLHGPSVESWHSKEPTRVMVTLEIDNVVRVIERTRRPIHLQVDGVEVEQARIDKLLGIDYGRFLQTVLMGQFGTTFADMKATARLDLLADVLDLDIWTSAQDEANKFAREIDDELRKAEREAHGVEKQLETVNEQKTQLTARLKQQDAQRSKKIEDCEERIKNQQELTNNLELIADEATRVCSEAQLYYSSVVEDRDAAFIRVSTIKQQQATLRGEEKALQRDKKEAVKRLYEIAELHTGCELCGQSVTEDQVSKLSKSAHIKADKAEQALKDCEAKRERLADKLSVAEKIQGERVQEANDVGHKVEQLDSEMFGKRQAAQRSQSRLQYALSEREVLENEVSPIADLLDDVDIKIEVFEAKAAEANAALHDWGTQSELVKDWPKLFKEVRLWIVEQALDEFEVYVNSALVELGLRGWSIKFSVERETKSGSVSKSFDIMVNSPANPEPVAWECWSGGESQRLRIACAVGLANLIRSRMANPPALEVWDEPTNHLNVEGVQDLVSFMASRSRDKQIWMVDHRSLDCGDFNDVLTVAKTAAGSELVED